MNDTELNDTDLAYFNEIANPIITHPIYLSLKQFPHHSNYSIYDHSLNVTMRCFRFVKKHKIKCNYKALIRASLLHDLYLYDWHNKNKGFHFHGFIHPLKAVKNSSLICELTSKEKRIIYSHMWPLNLLRFPTSKEGWILTLIDKVQSLKETFSKKEENPKN